MENFVMDDVVTHGLLDVESVLKVNWELTPHCNYKCSYCFGNAGMKNSSFSTLDQLKNVVDKLMSLNKKYYNILLIGGEPTIHPQFLNLLKYFNSLDKNISMIIVSNGSRPISYFEELFNSISNKELLLNISVHLEHADLEHIKDIIKLGNKFNKFIVLSFMIHPEKMDKAEKFLNEFTNLRNEAYFDISFRELREPPMFDRNDKRYTEYHYKWIDNARKLWANVVKKSKVKPIKYNSGIPEFGYNIKNGNEIINNLKIDYGISIRNNLKNFKGFYCLSGSNFIYINSDFTYKAGICPQLTNLGNILNDDNIKIKMEICNQYQCGCDSDDIIPKFRNLQDASLFINKNINFYMPYLISELLIKDHYYKIENLKNDLNKYIKINNRIIDKLAWWIPFKKLRDSFRNKMLNTD